MNWLHHAHSTGLRDLRKLGVTGVLLACCWCLYVGDTWAAPGEQQFRKAEQRYKAGRYTEALAYYRQAVEKDHSLWMAYYRMGECYEHQGKFGHAMAALLEGLDYNPGQATLMRAVAERRKSRASARSRAFLPQGRNGGSRAGVRWGYGAGVGYAHFSLASEREDKRAGALRRAAATPVASPATGSYDLTEHGLSGHFFLEMVKAFPSGGALATSLQFGYLRSEAAGWEETRSFYCWSAVGEETRSRDLVKGLPFRRYVDYWTGYTGYELIEASSSASGEISALTVTLGQSFAYSRGAIRAALVARCGPAYLHYSRRVEGSYHSPIRGDDAGVNAEAKLSGWGIDYFLGASLAWRVAKGMTVGLKVGGEFLRVEELAGEEVVNYIGLGVYENWLRRVRLVMVDNGAGGREYRLLDKEERQRIRYHPAPFDLSGLRLSLETGYEF